MKTSDNVKETIAQHNSNNVTTLRFAPSNFIPSLTKVSLELTQHRINHVRRIKDTAEAKAMTTTPKMPYL